MTKYILCIFLQVQAMSGPMILEPKTGERAIGPIPIMLYIGNMKGNCAIKLSAYLGSMFADLREKLIERKKRSFEEFVFLNAYDEKIIFEKNTELVEGQPYILFCTKTYGKTD